MNFCFISAKKTVNNFLQDPSFRYRSESLGLALQQANCAVKFLHFKQFSWRDLPRVVILHRPSWSLRLWGLIKWLNYQKVKVWADFDDLVFDPQYAEYSPAVLNQQLPLAKIRQRFQRHQRVLSLVDGVFVSTQPLVEHLSRLYPSLRVEWLPNAIHQSWRVYDEEPLPAVNWEQPILSYLPGTKSHDRDFLQFAEPLTAFLHDYPQVQLRVTGPLNFGLPVREHQLKRQAKVPFEAYHPVVADTWVNLAPLELTPFTRCKSALKVMEAAYWGHPTLISPLPDAERFIGNGAVIVRDADDVYNALVRFLDRDYYEHYCATLRERSLPLMDVTLRAKQMLSVLTVS